MPEHEIEVQGAPILRIHRIAEPAEIARLLALGRARFDPRAAAARFASWLNAETPEVRGEVHALLDRLLSRDPSAMLRLAELIPERLHRDTALMLRSPTRFWRPGEAGAEASVH